LAPSHPGLEVQELKDKAEIKSRKFSVLHGLSPAVQFRAFNSNHLNVKRALLERVFYIKCDGVFVEPHTPSRKFVFEKLTSVFRFFRKHVSYTRRMTQNEFCGSYTGRKRKVYEQAFESLGRYDLTRKDSIVKFFIKCEKVDTTNKEDPVPRGISPRDPRYHVELGRYIKPVEKKIYRVIDKMFGHPTVFKGLNSYTRAKLMREKWDGLNDPVALDIDVMRFDQSVNSVLKVVENQLLCMWYPRSKKLATLLSWQLNNTGYANTPDGRIKFTVKGKRMSGDMNTSLGNVLLMCSLFHSYLDGLSIKSFLANDGDDCVLIIERRDVKCVQTTIKSFFESFGLRLTVGAVVDTFEQIKFCQAQPVCVDGVWLMVRDPKMALAKDCVCLKPLDNEKIFKKWVASVGVGGLALAGRVPIWQEFYQNLVLASGGVKPLAGDPIQETGFQFLAKGMRQSYGKITPSTRLSFYNAFGYEPEVQRRIEESFLSETISFIKQDNYGRVASLF